MVEKVSLKETGLSSLLSTTSLTFFVCLSYFALVDCRESTLYAALTFLNMSASPPLSGWCFKLNFLCGNGCVSKLR